MERIGGGVIVGDTKEYDPSPWLGYGTVVLFGYNHMARNLPLGTVLVWCKRNDAAFDSFLSDAELAWMKGGHGVYCYRDVPNISDRGLHPTQKPVPVMAWCMEQAAVPKGVIVFDPYMGSGSTAIACIRTERIFYGCEIDPVHYATADARIRRELAQGRLAL